jgi:ABC-type antimicrobial peptide transport system permease subunit
MADNTTNGGIGFSGLLQITFIVLKLLDKISWSWWWVVSPTWIGIALVVLVLLIVGVIAVWADKRQDYIRKKRIQTMEDYKRQIDTFQKSKR